MKTKLYSLYDGLIGEIDIEQHIFGLEPRVDLIKAVIDWQLAKRRKGSHKTKTVAEVSGTGKKPFAQKGTGRARQGSLRSVHMRGGGVAHGPLVRSHATNLNKKIRKLGLAYALSSKIVNDNLIIVNDLDIKEHKTKHLLNILASFEKKSFCIIGGDELNKNLVLASKNLYNVLLLPQIGANVYDVIKHEGLILSQNSLRILESRLTI